MKKNIMPLVLMILIISLLFTACGGDDGRLAALEEENAALKAQLTELEGKIAEMEQTTPVERTWSSKYFVDGEFALPTGMVAESPANIEEFCGIAWGEGYDSLFVDPHANVVEQKAVIYGGIMGSAFYVFTDGGLSKGQIAFFALSHRHTIKTLRGFHLESGAAIGKTSLVKIGIKWGCYACKAIECQRREFELLGNNH